MLPPYLLNLSQVAIHNSKYNVYNSEKDFIWILQLRQYNLWFIYWSHFDLALAHTGPPTLIFLAILLVCVCVSVTNRSSHPVGQLFCRRCRRRQSWSQSPVCSATACGAEQPDRMHSQQLWTHKHTQSHSLNGSSLKNCKCNPNLLPTS